MSKLYFLVVSGYSFLSVSLFPSCQSFLLFEVIAATSLVSKRRIYQHYKCIICQIFPEKQKENNVILKCGKIRMNNDRDPIFMQQYRHNLFFVKEDV